MLHTLQTPNKGCLRHCSLEQDNKTCSRLEPGCRLYLIMIFLNFSDSFVPSVTVCLLPKSVYLCNDWWKTSSSYPKMGEPVKVFMQLALTVCPRLCAALYRPRTEANSSKERCLHNGKELSPHPKTWKKFSRVCFIFLSWLLSEPVVKRVPSKRQMSTCLAEHRSNKDLKRSKG